MSNRRQFLAGCLGSALPPVKSRVVIARDTDVVKMLDRAMQAMYNRDSAIEAWKLAVRPSEVIGLKVNCLAGKGGASTRPALVEAVCERLQQAGVPARNIVIWDRLNQDLEGAGFRIATSSGRIRTIGNDVLGYGSELEVHGSAGSLVATTLSRVCDAVINLPVLKDHGITGVTMALKNLFGAIHNPNKYHLDAGDPYIADVNLLPSIRGKVRLTLCDAETAQYEGGPTYMPQWRWRFGGMLASRDPVALDTVGWEIIERERAQRGMKPLKQVGREPKYIATAAARGIGTNDPARIERLEV